MKRSGLVLVLMILTIFCGWHCGYEKFAPNELVGLWETSAPKYADRFLKIDTDTITFGIGGGNIEIYTIKKLKMKEALDERSVLYTIYYDNEEGDEYTFTFYYSPERGGTIRLKHQSQIVWKKQSNR
jgi:hypothetical protein